MEITKKAGRATFRAEVTRTERGDWRIRAGAHECVISLTGKEADAWVGIPARVDALLNKLARSKPAGAGGPRRVRYHASAWKPLDGEERVYVIAKEKRLIGDVVTGDVRCTSPRCRTADGREPSWWVVQFPGSTYDRVEPAGTLRVEGISPDDFAEQHRAWHRDTYPPSPRVLLNQWIDHHKAMVFPEA